MKQLLNAMDLAARRGADKEIGLVQQIINAAPEIAVVSGRPVAGTTSTAKVQIGIPKGGAFRALNDGSPLSAGSYEMRKFNAYAFDAHLQVDELELAAAQQEGDSMGDLQADEIAGALQNKGILFSQQFYNGAVTDPNGFPGLIDILNVYNGGDGKGGVIDSRTGKALVNFIDAGSTAATASTECVWYVWNHPQGIHFIYGGNKTIDVNPWVWQYVNGKTAGTRLRASCSNISGFIGLAAAHPFSVACIKNIDPTHPWTDALTTKLDAIIPAGVKYTHCFATKRARGLLQQSRTVIIQANQSTGNAQNISNVSQTPTTDMNGVPITVTDGIQLAKSF